MQDATPTVAMKADEIEMLSRHLAPGSRYLEFGSGGSTLFALQRGVCRCDSVESDGAWLEGLRQDTTIREAEASGRLRFHPMDIGPVGTWGRPVDRSGLRRWPSYFLSVWGQLEADPDVVLIDGRFRTACALTALATCGPETRILMHDFFDPAPLRRNYRSVLEVADIAEQASNLVLLRRKPSVAVRELTGRVASVWTDFG